MTNTFVLVKYPHCLIRAVASHGLGLFEMEHSKMVGIGLMGKNPRCQTQIGKTTLCLIQKITVIIVDRLLVWDQ